MPDSSVQIDIPNRALFKAAEVCELLKVQPYVLRSWEVEFPDLGVTKNAGGPRIYRRADVEQVQRIKHLLLVEGLTLAGARRKLEEETAPVGANALVLTDPPYYDAIPYSDLMDFFYVWLRRTQVNNGVAQMEENFREALVFSPIASPRTVLFIGKCHSAWSWPNCSPATGRWPTGAWRQAPCLPAMSGSISSRKRCGA